ncbi:uncharacterized protein LOC134990792, partial [Pseudophryne corroboree]|uniref:uncharacterized protein LOC134990792 n=1 Tax=Pseudophryne corroboree TaxID=495146 RepID=UPI0030812AAE
YSLSRPETQAMAEYIQENLAKGFIRPSQSPVGSGFFFVGKKDGSLRPCIDFRELNRITIKNSYPLPLISVLFDQLRTATIFSKIDLRGAYNLIRIREGDEWKTAFNTHSGHYEYLVMPFGLSNAPAVFQEFMNDVLREYLDRFLVVYLDDILIFSHSLEEHRKHVRLVLQKLRDHQLGAKLEKCEFEVQQIAFLGYIISSEGFQMEGSKVQAVLDWVQPTSLKALQRFLGFANFYRRFIAGFSSIVAPLVALTKKGADVAHWSCEAKAAFARLKRAFVSAKVLRHPDPERPFVVEVDASEIGIGAVLSQMGVSDNRLHPCAYFSRKFSSAEMNYDVGNRELLAIKDALGEWRHWLEGAKFVVSILTDHKPVVQDQKVCLKDTTAFLLQLEKLSPLPENYLMCTIDVISLYTNIPHQRGIEAIRRCITGSHKYNGPDINFFIKLLELTLAQNYFIFDGRFFRQCSGCAMGSCVAPSFANIFMREVENDLFLTNPNVAGSIKAYFRYIDDIFVLWSGSQESFQQAMLDINRLDDSIKFTYSTSYEEIHYLDVAIKQDHLHHLHTSLFVKETDINTTLHANSHHPPTLKWGLPYSQYMRIRRICSDQAETIKQMDIMTRKFIERGYKLKHLREAKSRALKHDRISLLNKTQNTRKPDFIVWTQDFSTTSMSTMQKAKQIWPIITQDKQLQSIKGVKILPSYRRGRNIKGWVVHNDVSNLKVSPPGHFLTRKPDGLDKRAAALKR